MATPFDTAAPAPSPCDYTPFDDEGNYSKFSFIVKPAQGGKTGRMINLIRENNTRALFLGTTEEINFIFHGLTKTLGRQTASRLAAEDSFAFSDILSWNSDGEIECNDDRIENTNKSAEEVLHHCLRAGKKYILCCSNPTRFNHFMALLASANYLRSLGAKIPNVNIFIDEADQSMSMWAQHKVKLDTMDIVNNVFLVTATPEPILSETGSRFRVSLDEQPVVPGRYVGTTGQDFVLNDTRAYSTYSYIVNIFEEECLADKLLPGTRWFVPADVEKSSHGLVRAFFGGHGCNVVLVNGESKAIYFADGRGVLDLTDEILDGSEELGAIIKRYWLDESYGLQTAPLVITGNLCIERGITFQDSREGAFLFDYAIIADIELPAKAYQVMARMFGNFEHIRGEHRGTIYTTTAMKEAIERQESIAFRFSEVAREKGTIDYTDLLLHFPTARQRLRDCLRSYRHTKVFATMEEAIAWANPTLGRYHSKATFSTQGRPPALRLPNGVSSGAPVDWWRRKMRNPTREEIISNWAGFSHTTRPAQLMPLDDLTWCVAWDSRYVFYNPDAPKLRVKRSA